MIYKFLKNRMLNFPDATLRDEENCITYKELFEKAEHIGKKLSFQKYGILCKSELNTAVLILACFYAKKNSSFIIL